MCFDLLDRRRKLFYVYAKNLNRPVELEELVMVVGLVVFVVLVVDLVAFVALVIALLMMHHQ